jgi:hypothetical protein
MQMDNEGFFFFEVIFKCLQLNFDDSYITVIRLNYMSCELHLNKHFLKEDSMYL